MRPAAKLTIALLALAVSARAQVSFDDAVRDLASEKKDVRLSAARMLKAAAYPEAAVPLVAAVTDVDDEVQLEAIGAELNTFFAEKVVVRKRVGLIVEVRNQIAAEAAFAQGPLALGPRPVPRQVLVALLSAARDDNPRVALEALYAFGVLAIAPGGAERREVLGDAGPTLAALTGAADAAQRYAALRVIGRVFQKRLQDGPVDPDVGDAVIQVLNDKDRTLKVTAMETLGAMRYERSVQALLDLFAYHKKGDEAAASLDALARIGHASAAEVFTAQLQAKNAPMRGIAIEGIARIGDRAKLSEVESALRGERNDNLVLAGAFATAMLSDAPIDSLAEGLARPKQHDFARQYLVEITAKRPTVLARQAQDPDAKVRAEVADILGLAGNPASLPLAESMLKDADAQVARAAERAVATLKRAGS
jgi:HEAT repeat protein